MLLASASPVSSASNATVSLASACIGSAASSSVSSSRRSRAAAAFSSPGSARSEHGVSRFADRWFEWRSITLLLRECRLVPLGDDLRVLLLLRLLSTDGIIFDRSDGRLLVSDGRLLVSDDLVNRDGIISDGRLAMTHLRGRGKTCARRGQSGGAWDSPRHLDSSHPPARGRRSRPWPRPP